MYRYIIGRHVAGTGRMDPPLAEPANPDLTAGEAGISGGFGKSPSAWAVGGGDPDRLKRDG